MQVQKLQAVLAPIVPLVQPVVEVLDVPAIVSDAPSASVSCAAAHGVFGIGEQNGDEQGSQVLPGSQGEGGWIPLSPVDLPVARVGSAVNAQPDELRAVRKCLLAAARAAWPQKKFSWKSLIKFDARIFNPHWQAGLVDSFRTDGSQLFTEDLTEMFTEDPLFVEKLQKPETH
jgi:hypothetical protein